MRLFRFPRIASLILLSAVLAVSCSKDSGITEPPDNPDSPSSAKSFSSFAFTVADNPALNGTCSSRIVDGTICVTIPFGVPLSSLKASFKLSPKAKAEIDGKALTSGTTAADYSKLIKVKVIAEDNSYGFYYVNVQHGIQRLDDMVYNFMEKYSIPGMSVSVAYNEKLVFARGYGYADRENHERMESHYMLRLASCSKPFTSMCIMRLLDEGKISLEDKPFAPNGVLYNQFPNHKEAFEQMTIRNFLEHTSGIANNPFDPMFDNSVTTQLSNTETIEYVVQNFTPNYSPGGKHQYSNFGYCVLGRIIEAITGKTYEEYLKKAVLNPAGVKNIRVGSTGRSNRFENESVYYSQSGDGYNNNMKRLDSCGGLIASTPDLMKLACKLDALSGIPDIFPKYILDLMQTPSVANTKYALGWRVGHSLYPGAAYHSGNLSGTATMWCRNYNGDTDCAILCNSRSYLSDSGGSFDDALYVLLHNVLALGNWPDQDLFPQYE